MDASGWTMDRAQVDLVLHNSSSIRWMGIRSISIKIQLEFIGTEVVPNQPMPPYSNHHSHPMDTHRSPLILVIVNMHIPHMRQRETPRWYAVPIPTAPIPTAPSQWTIGSSTQGQERYYYSGAAAYSQPPYTSPTHATRSYEVYTPAGSSSGGSGSIARTTSSMVSGAIPPSATVPLDMRPPS